MTTPTTPLVRQLHAASSPNTAMSLPPASITRTSPGEARSIASTGLHQSPLVVCTVSARPTIFVPGAMRGTMFFITPNLCMASAMLHVEVLENASNSSSAPNFLDAAPAIACRCSMAFLSWAAAPLTSLVLMMLPPAMIMEAPASSSWGAVSDVMPPATAMGMETAEATFSNTSTGEPAARICSSMPTCRQTYEAPSSSARFALAGRSATPIRSTMTFAPYWWAVRTASEIVPSSARPRTETTSAPALAAISTSKPPTSMVFMSATSTWPGNVFLRTRSASEPSDFSNGVPASIQSAPPSTASAAMSTARFRCIRSRATWRTGLMTCRRTSAIVMLFSNSLVSSLG